MERATASTTSRAAVLVTGANGFVGSVLIQRLLSDERYAIKGAVREGARPLPSSVERVVVSDVNAHTDWSALSDVGTIVHLAARVHVMHDKSRDALEMYRKVNVGGTLNLARQAARSGVKRFVFLSSIKVNGESGTFSEADAPAPSDPYGISKHEAEEGLRCIASETAMEVVIIRPPLVYGPGVKANFLALIKAVDRGIPLPFGSIRNRRSLIGAGNLADFILTCMEAPAAANETFLVSDGMDLSTAELIRGIARALDRPARLIPVPASVLMSLAVLVGKRAVAQRLLSSLQLDINKARNVLSWMPPFTVDQGLDAAIAGYREHPYR